MIVFILLLDVLLKGRAMKADQRQPKKTLTENNPKAARGAELLETIHALIEQADADLDAPALAAIALPDCPVARKAAATARQALSTETQVAP